MSDTTAIAPVNPMNPLIQFRARLDARRDELKNMLPSDITPEQFIRALTSSAYLTPDLLACSFSAVWKACIQAARDGLRPDGREGVLVPFKNSCTWIPMYTGMIKRFRMSGQCRWIGSDVVRAGEEFLHFVDEHGTHFRHTPGDNQKAPVVRVYAAALTKDDAFFLSVLSMDEIERIRAQSRGSREDAPWKKWPEEMMKKSAVRRLYKYLPQGSELMAGDELPEIGDAPAMQAPLTPLGEQQQIQRPQSAADALDQFAGSPDAPAAPSSDGDGAEQGAADAGTIGSATDHDDEQTASNATLQALQISDAYESGKKAKLDGLSRKAIPGEYRGPEHSREAIAWQAGFDGKPAPSWSQG